jgi:hypothetical protein
MGFAAITFLVLFLLIASGGLLVFYRAAMLQRRRGHAANPIRHRTKARIPE